MAGIDGAADLDYSLTVNAGLASVLSARAIGLDAVAGDDDDEPAAPRPRDDGDDGIEDLLDWLDLGVIIADATARPVRMNRRAGAIAARKDGLYATPFGITTAIPEETGRLRQAIAAAPAGGTRLRLSRPSGAPPLLVTVIPVRPDRGRGRVRRRDQPRRRAAGGGRPAGDRPDHGADPSDPDLREDRHPPPGRAGAAADAVRPAGASGPGPSRPRQLLSGIQISTRPVPAQGSKSAL